MSFEARLAIFLLAILAALLATHFVETWWRKRRARKADEQLAAERWMSRGFKQANRNGWMQR